MFGDTFYLNDVNENSGGTQAVPRSHIKIKELQRSLDGITLTAPMEKNTN